MSNDKTAKPPHGFTHCLAPPLPEEQRLKKKCLVFLQVLNTFPPCPLIPLSSSQVNSSDEDGVLEGRWDGEYSDGVAPYKWSGSVRILEQYVSSGYQPVKYGQCWVFSALVTTGKSPSFSPLIHLFFSFTSSNFPSYLPSLPHFLPTIFLPSFTSFLLTLHLFFHLLSFLNFASHFLFFFFFFLIHSFFLLSDLNLMS